MPGRGVFEQSSTQTLARRPAVGLGPTLDQGRPEEVGDGGKFVRHVFRPARASHGYEPLSDRYAGSAAFGDAIDPAAAVGIL